MMKLRNVNISDPERVKLLNKETLKLGVLVAVTGYVVAKTIEQAIHYGDVKSGIGYQQILDDTGLKDEFADYVVNNTTPADE